MIGDDPVQDCAAARAAGIEQVVLPRRQPAVLSPGHGLVACAWPYYPQRLGIPSAPNRATLGSAGPLRRRVCPQAQGSTRVYAH